MPADRDPVRGRADREPESSHDWDGHLHERHRPLLQSQGNAGAIGIPGTRCIKETGAAAGSLNDGLTHPAKLGATFCIPVTGNAAVNLVGDLPGPGALGLNTNAQALP